MTESTVLACIMCNYDKSRVWAFKCLLLFPSVFVPFPLLKEPHQVLWSRLRQSNREQDSKN